VTDQPTIHLDLVAHVQGEQYMLGHADISVNPDGTLCMSNVADLLHSAAWQLESNGSLDIDEATPVEPNKKELGDKPQVGRVFEDSLKGRWYEVRPDRFVKAHNWNEAGHIYETHKDDLREFANEATLRNVYTMIREVESD
jgi:hypothetical protein